MNKIANRLSRVLITIGVIAAMVLAVPRAADAATDTADLAVSAEVSASCSISTTALAFGAYDPIVANASTALDQTGGVVVTCTSGAATTVTLGQGLQPTGASTASAPARQMASGINRLGYDLYSDSARTVVWGDTAGTGVAHTGTGTATTLTVHGRVPAAQNVPAGSYTDTVVATVTF